MNINDVLNVANNEVGYLEKKTNANLDDKTANAGDKNYTKYARDLFPDLQANPWCDMFVDWCFVQAYGLEKAKELLGGGLNAYTPSSAQYFKNKGRWHISNPKIGDVVFFKNSVRINHTGIIYNVDGSNIYTIEGNTSGANGVVENGGGVCKKQYSLSNSRIAGYGRPNYSETTMPSASDTYNATVIDAPNGLRVRSEPSTSSGIVRKLSNGSQVKIAKESGNWGYIGDGWVCLTYIAKTSSNVQKPVSNGYSEGTYQVTANALKVRVGAGTGYRQKAKKELTKDGQKHSNANGSLLKGTRLTIYEIKGNWGRCPSGWVCLDYCEKI